MSDIIRTNKAVALTPKKTSHQEEFSSYQPFDNSRGRYFSGEKAGMQVMDKVSEVKQKWLRDYRLVIVLCALLKIST